jgi:uncharacterized phage protein (TIGR01671 family)
MYVVKDISWHYDTMLINAKTKGEAFTNVRVKDLNLMQFTGLLDKNGKEIYEGDIVADSDMQGEVMFDKEKAAFYAWWRYAQPKKGQRTDPFIGGYFDKERAEEVKVISNIYENPELMTQV